MRPVTTILIMTLLLPLSMYGADETDTALKKSAYFAFVGREFIFTIEVVKPGTPILNFVSITDRDENLQAKSIRLSFGNRQIAAELFSIETDRYQQPSLVPSLTMHPRSSFGFRLEGNFGKSIEISGAEIRLGEDTFKLAPLSKFDFETLVRKINRINLGSPDFRDDYRVLKLDYLGSRLSKSR
jgi:hypothetical protein